jgi:hypothetical protein
MDFLDFIIVVIVAIFTFLLLQYISFINIIPYLEYILIILLFLLLFYLCSGECFAMAGDDIPSNMAKVDVQDNNLNITNANISISDKAFDQAGTGVLIGGGMKAMATVLKKSSLPPSAKVGIVAGGGAVAAGLGAGYKYFDNTIQNSNKDSSIPSSSSVENVMLGNDKTNVSGSDPFSSASSINESNLDNVLGFLYSNFIVHIAILYLLIILIIILISKEVVNKYLDVIVKNNNNKFVKYIVKYLKYMSNMNNV